MDFTQYITKSGTSLKEKATRNAKTNQWFTASTPAIDRYNEIVMPEGIRMDNFLKNPIFGWGHDVYGWSVLDSFIGKVVDYVKTPETLDIEVEFIPDAGKHPDGSGYSYLDMVKGGFLSAVSIGFRGVGFHEEEKDGKGKVRIWDETELLEVSLVGIPANPEATRKSLELGFENQLVKDFTNSPAPSHDADTAAEIKRAFQAFKIRQMFHN